ncbi:MAG: transposase [Oscillibacter sp.]|nr:transposase [Oscillibacter sp.]
MHKDGKTTDNNRTRQKFCCPFRQSKTGVCPCNHKNWNNGKKNRGCVKYRIVPTDYRLSIDRSCLCFKRTYALRTECEWVRNGASAANLNTLAHISALAVALAAVLHGFHSYRSAKQLRRSA